MVKRSKMHYMDQHASLEVPMVLLPDQAQPGLQVAPQAQLFRAEAAGMVAKTPTSAENAQLSSQLVRTRSSLDNAGSWR